ncbi:hypothetical protein C8J56DRAFT_887701 [Mycena floridula]|nr:hypothetical protein C8J56DRAFT_887701 [Mycena floridula]
MGDEADVKRAKREKRKQEKSEAAAQDPVVDVEKKKKKRKRETVEENVEGNVEENVEEPPKKKSKNKTGFPNPLKEKGLSDQARKGLGYAFTQFRHPADWKFHKARQNWLIRNIYSPQAIPDAHVPLVATYLGSLQGSARENVLKKCKSIVESASVNDAEPSPEAATTPETIRLARARAILEKLEVAPKPS